MAEDGSARTAWDAGILSRVGDMVYDARRDEWLICVDPATYRPMPRSARWYRGLWHRVVGVLRRWRHG